MLTLASGPSNKTPTLAPLAPSPPLYARNSAFVPAVCQASLMCGRAQTRRRCDFGEEAALTFREVAGLAPLIMIMQPFGHSGVTHAHPIGRMTAEHQVFQMKIKTTTLSIGSSAKLHLAGAALALALLPI